MTRGHRADRYIYEGGTKRHPQWNNRLNYPDDRAGALAWRRDGGDAGPTLGPFEIAWLIIFGLLWAALWL